MKIGLVLGKFSPLHKGHIALIEFALEHCDRLILLLCSTPFEFIAGDLRKRWLEETFEHNRKVQIEHLEYDENELSNTSESSREVSAEWAAFIRITFPQVNIFFSSEPYGAYVAEYLQIEYRDFDLHRTKFAISSTAILKNPILNWNFISRASQSFFVKKISILGTESTGKSTLSRNLANYYSTVYVPEMARDIIEKTDLVKYEDLHLIAVLQSRSIIQKLKQANRVLLSDTDLTTTRSYSRFLFNKELQVESWVEEANKFDLHIFLETDCPFVQDGTRLPEKERNRLSDYHRNELNLSGIPFIAINGSWNERFEKARQVIDEKIFLQPLNKG